MVIISDLIVKSKKKEISTNFCLHIINIDENKIYNFLNNDSINSIDANIYHTLIHDYNSYNQVDDSNLTILKTLFNTNCDKFITLFLRYNDDFSLCVFLKNLIIYNECDFIIDIFDKLIEKITNDKMLKLLSNFITNLSYDNDQFAKIFFNKYYKYLGLPFLYHLYSIDMIDQINELIDDNEIIIKNSSNKIIYLLENNNTIESSVAQNKNNDIMFNDFFNNEKNIMKQILGITDITDEYVTYVEYDNYHDYFIFITRILNNKFNFNNIYISAFMILSYPSNSYIIVNFLKKESFLNDNFDITSELSNNLVLLYYNYYNFNLMMSNNIFENSELYFTLFFLINLNLVNKDNFKFILPIFQLTIDCDISFLLPTENKDTFENIGYTESIDENDIIIKFDNNINSFEEHYNKYNISIELLQQLFDHDNLIFILNKFNKIDKQLFAYMNKLNIQYDLIKLIEYADNH